MEVRRDYGTAGGSAERMRSLSEAFPLEYAI
jgi:hypothetical protein